MTLVRQESSLTLLHREHTDYVEISRRLYEGQTIMENGYMEGGRCNQY